MQQYLHDRQGKIVQIEKYINYIRQRIKPLLEKKTTIIKTTHRCCIRISEKEVSLIHINKIQEIVEIFLLEALQYDDLESLALLLSSIVDKNHLEEIPTYWLLSPEDYQLFLIDSLPVEANELRDALSWRIRSLISYPYEEAAIDYFQLPAKKSAAGNSMIAAISTHKNRLENILNIFKNSNLLLTTIDIPELAMRNLTASYENDEKSTAFVYFNNDTVILNITCKKILYFTRRIALPSATDTPEKRYEALCLDILRYFDYFQSQWRYPSPSRIFVATEKENAVELAKTLSNYLLLTVEAFTLPLKLSDQSKIQLIEKNYLLNLGCALREE